MADYLRRPLGKENVFQDLTSLQPGVPFPEEISRWIDSCTAMVVIISRNWPVDRLISETDYVRWEIKLAFHRKLDVFPLLIDGAGMPAPSELPEDIRSLAYRHAIDLPQHYFQEGLRKLLQAIRPWRWKGNVLLLSSAAAAIVLVVPLVLNRSGLRNGAQETARSTTSTPAPGATVSASTGKTLQIPGIFNGRTPDTYSDVVTLPAGSLVKATRVFAKELNVPEWTVCKPNGIRLICGNGPERLENLWFRTLSPHTATSDSARTVTIDVQNLDVRDRQVRLQVEYTEQTRKQDR